MRTWQINTDLLAASGIRSTIDTSRESDFELLFYPKEFSKKHGPLTFDDYDLSEGELLRIGGEVSELRRNLRVRARDLEESKSLEV